MSMNRGTLVCLMVTNEYIRTIEFIRCETADSEIKRKKKNNYICTVNMLGKLMKIFVR
jgi:hypothetical protein